MLNEFIKGIALIEGSDVYTSWSEETLDYEGYARIFNSQDVKELVVSTESSYIFAKRYDRNIIILIMNKIAPLSISISKARVAARKINALYMHSSLDSTKLLKYKVEVEASRAANEAKTKIKPSLVDSIALSIYQVKKEAKKKLESEAIKKENEDKEELQELAKEILKFKRSWMEKKKKVEEYND
jgi:hypothetical protein